MSDKLRVLSEKDKIVDAMMRTAETLHAKAAMFDEMLMALKAVSAGIWRDKKMNACGLACPAITVHIVEKVLAKASKLAEDK